MFWFLSRGVQVFVHRLWRGGTGIPRDQGGQDRCILLSGEEHLQKLVRQDAAATCCDRIQLR